MGRATIKCTSGCTCESLNVDGTCHDREVSLTYMAPLAASQHERCVLEITVSKKTSSSGNKFKVGGMLCYS